MRPPPSENFRNMASTFHSMSVGGRFCGLLKKISYSIFRRRSCESRTLSSSSVVTGFSKASVGGEYPESEVPMGHGGEWYESKGKSYQPSAFSCQLRGHCGCSFAGLHAPIRRNPQQFGLTET